MRAARQVGEDTTTECPICEERPVVHVTYVFGPKLPPFGRCISKRDEMVRLNRRRDALTAYIVEVCPDCSWHHLIRTVPIGGRR